MFCYICIATLLKFEQYIGCLVSRKSKEIRGIIFDGSFVVVVTLYVRIFCFSWGFLFL